MLVSPHPTSAADLHIFIPAPGCGFHTQQNLGVLGGWVAFRSLQHSVMLLGLDCSLLSVARLQW
jgi:hypothetical protein